MSVKCDIWALSFYYLIWQGRDISCLYAIGWPLPLCLEASFNPCVAELFLEQEKHRLLARLTNSAALNATYPNEMRDCDNNNVYKPHIAHE